MISPPRPTCKVSIAPAHAYADDSFVRKLRTGTVKAKTRCRTFERTETSKRRRQRCHRALRRRRCCRCLVAVLCVISFIFVVVPVPSKTIRSIPPPLTMSGRPPPRFAQNPNLKYRLFKIHFKFFIFIFIINVNSTL